MRVDRHVDSSLDGRARSWSTLPSVYRFLLSPRWIGLGLVMTLAAVAMVGLGLWQLDRYHERSDINARIDAGSSTPPRPLTEVLPPPAGAKVGPVPDDSVTWTQVSVTGRYDPGHEIVARVRTLNGEVGFEILTPLLLPGGSAVIVDRGWLSADDNSAGNLPTVPATPAGQVTVTGRVHAPESRATGAEPFHGVLAVRRISPQLLAESLPYPVYGAYVTLDRQTPPADPAFHAIPPDHENAAMNAGYVVQWWMFALLTLVGFGYLVVREGRAHSEASDEPAEPPAAGEAATAGAIG